MKCSDCQDEKQCHVFKCYVCATFYCFHCSDAYIYDKEDFLKVSDKNEAEDSFDYGCNNIYKNIKKFDENFLFCEYCKNRVMRTLLHYH